jgi:hypothetical protein
MLMTREGLCEAVNITINNLDVRLWNHKQKYGEHPKWYIDGKIDFDKYMHPSKLNKLAWTNNTTYMYWVLTEIIGINVNKLASIFATKSKIYKSENSWNSFIGNKLFELSDTNGRAQEYTQQMEFFRLSIVTISLWYRHNKDTEVYSTSLAKGEGWFE